MSDPNTPNPHAQALGRMGRGIPKTMTAKAIAARKRAAKFPRPNRRKEKMAQIQRPQQMAQS